MTIKSRQHFKYLENKKSFEDELKSIFQNFERGFIEIKQFFFNFLGGEGKSVT